MNGSRKPPFDRSRELSMKKPKLTDEPTLAGRQFQRSAANAPMASSALARFRANGRERETDDPSRGALQQYMQHQELVNQYKTALAELTFNSKPIITNLTIIAGESLQAAKAIAATICSNILEVPSEQKLPSLYLLDSIVKNIGGDYIKCFATRLPEVFCKVYRQVNPSIHPGMQRLFRTWREVFPPQTLQIIEKELGFQAATNGPSSGAATSKPDPQSQRQPHSIHVNPKYLEARQRLQQSNRPQGTNIGREDVEVSEDVGIPERTPNLISERPWTNPSVKMQTIRPQREALRESSHQKQGGVGYAENEFAPGLTKPSRPLVGKPNERLIGQGYDKRWAGASREAEESRNEYDVKSGISNYTAPRSAGGNIPSTQNPLRKRSNAEVSRSWKNSEEEEFIWDDLGTGATDPNALSGTNKDTFSSDGIEKLEFGSHLPKWQSQAEVRSSFERDTLSSEQKEQGVVGHSRSSAWKATHEPYQVDSSGPFLQQVGPRSATTGPMGQRHPNPRQSPMQQRSPSPSLSKRDPRLQFAEKDNIKVKSQSSGLSDPRTASFSGQINVGLRMKSSQNSMPAQNNNLQSGSPGQSDVSNLLAAVMKSGLLSSSSSVSEQPSIEPPTIAPIPSQATFTNSKGNMTSLSGLSRDSNTPSFPQIKAEKLPLPAVSLSSSSPTSSAPAQTSDMASASNPFSSLFSTLLAKGFISSSKTEEPKPLPPLHAEDQVKERKDPIVTSKPLLTDEFIPDQVKERSPIVPSKPLPMDEFTPKAPTTDKPSSSESTGKKSETSAQSTKDEIENLIGFEFRPPILRELHQAVIDRVTDEVPHKCSTCGLGFRLNERLDRHSEWHAFRDSVPNSLIRPSRRWYSNSADWVSGKAGFPFGYKSTSFMEDSAERSESEKSEKMVPADESQSVCLLCGELFEDFYSQERDEWMFKEAVYMSIPSGSSESGSQNLIVHAKCSSDDSVNRLGFGLNSDIKVEKDA